MAVARRPLVAVHGLNSALAAACIMLAKPCSITTARCSLGGPVEEVVDGVAGLAVVPVAQANDAAVLQRVLARPDLTLRRFAFVPVDLLRPALVLTGHDLRAVLTTAILGYNLIYPPTPLPLHRALLQLKCGLGPYSGNPASKYFRSTCI
jgi:hypothetical protein